MKSAQRKIVMILIGALAIPAFAERDWPFVYETTYANGGIYRCKVDVDEGGGYWLGATVSVEASGYRFDGFSSVTFEPITGGIIYEYEPVSNAEYVSGGMGANAEDLFTAMAIASLEDGEAGVAAMAADL